MRLTTGAILLHVVFGASLARAQDAPRPPGTVKAEATTGSASAGVDSYVLGLMQKRHIPGVSVAVVQDGKVVLAKGYGLANAELQVPATENTVYQLASVTKTFTATAIMMLVKDGKLTLDDKITARLSDLPAAWEKVTVRQLLSHTSGIKSYTSVKDFHKTMRKDYAQREIIDLVAKEPLEFTPGEKWNYSNTGYFLLGMLIEKVAGKPYGEFMAERIFKPLGMSQTCVNDLRAIIPNRAQGYEWDGKELKNGEYVSPTQPFSAGMLVSSVSDLVKWDASLANHTLLDEPTLQQMWTPARLAKGEAGYGFGWGIDKVNGHRHVSHGGGIPGFSTELSRFPDDKLTVIVLTNSDGGHAGALARGIAGRFVPALEEKAAEAIADKDGKTTERLRLMLEGALKGEVDLELFTDTAKKALVPHIKEGKDKLAPLGALKTFELLERKENDGALQLRYRAVLEKETLKVFIALDKSGKIQGLGLQPED
ncbi:MAG: serine hydrolase [Paludisphaera borealis]|uniref:serine hydrolase domain-containing protein n=1 Tax=Paludisphaera borealis TaxID=1387353 RepID=UPI002844059A|nr:serine hydrolase domain-containing protein [Paludisphaera borealis]MDR3620618.1 serine hydrolase [Paludisphaera borealis]